MLQMTCNVTDAPIWGTLRVPISKEGKLSIPSAQGLLGQLENLAK